MKAYPLTDAHLVNLSLFDTFAGLLFSATTGCAVFVLDVSRDLSLAPDAAATSVAFWSGARIAVAVFGVLSFVGFAVTLFVRHGHLKTLKDNTVFDDDE